MLWAALQRLLATIRRLFTRDRAADDAFARWDLASINALLELPPGRELSETQARAVSSSARETLVVAGAGSGETTLLINRAKFLVASGRSDGSDILMLAFNREAATELQKHAASADTKLRATTFHALGNSIIKAPDERTGVAFAGAGERQACLERALREELDAHHHGLLAKFFAFDLVPTRTHGDFKDLAEYVAFVRSSIPVTLQGEEVKSHGEWLIANHLYRCGVQYEYEAVYGEELEPKHRHTPDFTVIAPDGRKIWVEYFDLIEGRLILLLDAALARNNIPTSMRSDAELLEQANKVGYTSRFLATCEQFLAHVRAQGLSVAELRRVGIRNPRTRAFLEVFEPLLEAYERELERHGLPDFPQLITGAVEQLRSGAASLGVKHLLVDEFQDISADRFELISAIRDQADACEVTFVGDDWQSIYEFSGSDIGIMRRIAKPAKHRIRIDMGDTYRLPTLIAEASRALVLQNPAQLSKDVRSLSPTADAGRIVTHWDTVASKPADNMRLVIERLGAAARDPEASLRVLARYRDHLPPEAALKKWWAGPVSVGSVHASKGLEADYIIITDLMADTRGFPSTIQDDDVMRLVLPEREAFPHAEERRLFYVAITRARREVHLIAPQTIASPFAFELIDMKIGEHLGMDSQRNSRCPACDSGRLLRSARTGGQYCTNTPLCDFFPPRCTTCTKPMRFDWDVANGYVCADHPDTCPPMCPRCKWGLLVTREFTSRRTGVPFVKESCHTWPRTRCSGKARVEAPLLPGNGRRR